MSKRELARLIRRIGAATDGERESVTRDLERHGVCSAETIVGIYRSNRRRLTSGHFLTTAAQGLALASVFAGAIILARARHEPFWCASVGILAMVCSLVVTAALCARREQYTKGIGYLLARFSDRSVLSPLLDVHAQYRDANRVIGRAIIRRLDAVESSDAHLLTGANRAHLYACLQEFSAGDGMTYGVNAGDFCRAILSALARIGDIAAIPHIERLARTAPDPCVREAAAQRLSSLRALARSVRTGSTLLRAAHPKQRPEELLRSAAPGQAETPWDLLRSASPGAVDEPGNRPLRNMQDAVHEPHDLLQAGSLNEASR